MFGFLFRSLQQKTDDMGFWDHVEVLRTYIIRSLLSIVILSFVAFFNKDFLFNSIILAPSEPSFITYRVLCKLGDLLNAPGLCVTKIPLQLINIELGGQFSYHIMISFICGIILAFPFIVLQFWLFIKPALRENERKHSTGIVFYISILFIIGVLFGFYVITPLTINFLASYQLSPLIINNITISSYISSVSGLSLSMGLVFELPVLIFFLSKIGIITPKFIREKRKYAIIIIFIVAGFITPSTDMFTQVLVSIPLFMLYELSYFISKKTVKKVEIE
ncbi:MAG: twin-arginine translocase subunit TatC [Bacteroidetes bacterium]|nr:twin-arginine translocase subunit TatC [Bacteroidota bacterium]